MSPPRPTATRWTDTRHASRFRLAAITAVLALLLTLVACGGDDQDDDSVVGSGSSKVSAADAVAQEQRILNQRARAIRENDLDLFLKRVNHRDADLMARQRRYFRNLVQLPLEKFAYRVSAEQWDDEPLAERWGDDVHVPQVTLTMQLRDFDALPLERTVGFVFSYRNGRATLVSDRSSSGKPLYRGTPLPWDLTAISVREEPGVLGIFDRRTAGSAPVVTAAVREGISQIRRALPFSWSGQVVVYSVENASVLASFRDVPGGAIDHLGAMTFPTYAEDDDRSQVASTRMLLMPSSVRAGEPFLGRITRHELSHVAIGVRDDGSPAWVSEGIAEYLGAREVPQRDRIIPTSALQRAQTADASMPVSREFNNSEQEWHYAQSWMACDYIAETFGESRLWELVDAMHNGGQGTPDADQDRVLEQILGFDSHELGLRAAARIRNIYG